MPSPLTPGYWNVRCGEEGFAYGQEPNAFLTSAVRHLRPNGRVLVPEDGEGRNGIWLAQQGFDVTMLYTAGCFAGDLAPYRSAEMTEVEADLAEGRFHRGRGVVVRAVFADVEL